MFRETARWALVFALCLGFASFSARAAAQNDEGATEPASESEALIRRGLEARRAGNDDRAVALFRQAFQLDPAPRAAAQLGLAEQALGRFVDARANLELALATSDPWVEENRSALEGAMSVVMQNIGRLEVIGGVSGASVRVDGEAVATLPLEAAIYLEVGSHNLEVIMEGYYAFARNVEVLPGDLTRISVQLRVQSNDAATTGAPAAGPARQEPQPMTRAPVASPLRPVGWALLSSGVLALGGGVAAAVIREGAASDWNDDGVCLSGGATREDNCAEFQDRADKAGLASTILFIGGGAMTLVGAVLVLVGKAPDEDSAGACVPGLGTVSCSLRF